MEGHRAAGRNGHKQRNIPPVTGFGADAALVRERAETGNHLA
jgi:hypothetical protein